MKLKFTLLSLLLIFCFAVNAQQLTGIWRGFFVSDSKFFPERYKFEVQIYKNPDNTITGVTYSYKNTEFYAKVECVGRFTASNNNILIKETKMLELRNTSGSTCSQTLFLTYSKAGKKEIMEGTYMSVFDDDKTSPCGDGTVYLEKVEESDFKKETFLIPVPKKTTPKPPVVVTPKKSTTPYKKTTTKKTTTQKSYTKKPDVPKKPITDKQDKITVTIPKIDIPDKPAYTAPPSTLPKTTRERENKLVKTFKVNADYITVDFYDNATIDNDTITIYHNNQVVASNKRLSTKPISLKYKIDEESPRHEFIMVAENMGEIPPNTATMIITAGKRRYEASLTATDQKNAVVVIVYDPKDYD